MDGSAFDKLVRFVTIDASRRSLLKAALVPVVAGVGAASLLGIEESEAGKKKRKKRCKKAGALCKSNKQCCPGKTNRICDIPLGDSGGDERCCGGLGAKCGGVNEDGDALPPFCCVGTAGVNEFVCSQNDENNPNVPGTCQPVIEEP